MTSPHTDFWTWSLDRYERGGAAELLLRLQDEHGLNVNLLLWCCWSAEFFEPVPGPVLREAETRTHDWNARVTAPLRSVRRYLKKGEEDEKKPRKALRKLVKDAELEAERVEQTRLETLAIVQLAPLSAAAGAAARAAKNLQLYAEQSDAERSEEKASSSADLLPALFQDLILNIVDETP